jgi:hypothetical protein
MVKSAGKTRVLELLSFLVGDEKAILVIRGQAWKQTLTE